MHFADNVGTPLIKILETPSAFARLLVYIVIVFAILIVTLSVVIIVLRHRLKLDKDDDVIKLP